MEQRESKSNIIDCAKSYQEIRSVIFENIKDCRELLDQTSPEKKDVLLEYSRMVENIGSCNRTVGEPLECESPCNKKNEPEIKEMGNSYLIFF